MAASRTASKSRLCGRRQSDASGPESRAQDGRALDTVARGQKVLPAEALASGFRFSFPSLDKALQAIVSAAPQRRPCRNAAPKAALNER
jgi:hypothetical protein